jgi:hypothetical protein
VQSCNTFALEALSLHGAGPEEGGSRANVKGVARPDADADATAVCRL